MSRVGRAIALGLVLLLPAAAWPEDDEPAAAAASGEQWQRAMELSDQQRYDESLEVIRAALERDPASRDLRWLEAGVLGWSGRHAESVAQYEALIADFPELADEVRMSVGRQRLDAGDPRGALKDAEAALERDPSSDEAARLRALALARSDQYKAAIEAYDALLVTRPDDAELLHDRATILGWMGQHPEAIAAYEAILERYPDDLRARIGIAKNENWRGNHQRAIALYQEMVEDGHDDPEVLQGLAQANYWGDRPEDARQVLDRLTEADPENDDARRMSELLRFEQKQTLSLGYETSEDTDDLRIRTTALGYRLSLPRQFTLLAMARRDDVDDRGGSENPVRFGAGFEKRWGGRFKAGAQAFYFDSGGAAGTHGLGQATLSYRPVDRWRFDFGLDLEPVMTRQSLALGIRSTSAGAAASWRVIDRVTLTGNLQYRDFSDGNYATAAGAGVRWNTPWRIKGRLALLFAADLLLTDQDLDNGYYDPARYLEFGPGAEWSVEVRDRASFSLDARTGIQQERGASWDPFYKIGASAGVRLSRALRLSAEIRHSNSNLSSATGFGLTRAGIYLTAAF